MEGLSERAALRVSKEIKRMGSNPPHGIGMWSLNDKLDTLEALIEGPKGTPYFGGEFRLSISIPSNYPNVPPVIKFKTSIYHPNIDKSGRICLDSLKSEPQGKWSPGTSLETILQQIQILMAEPNTSDPLDLDIAQQYGSNNSLFIETAKKWTEKYAMNIQGITNPKLQPLENDSD